MKKVMFLLVALSLFIRPCFAADHSSDDLLSLIGLTPETATQGKVTSLLGHPTRVEENKKTTQWFYTHDNTDLVISWSNKSELLLKFSYKCSMSEKCTFDNKLPGKLKSGTTNLTQALKLLGTPQDITIKEKTQEMHYAYQQKVLRLFFRDRVLVDYCLY